MHCVGSTEAGKYSIHCGAEALGQGTQYEWERSCRVNPEGKGSHAGLRSKCEDNIKTVHKQGADGVNWIHLAPDRVKGPCEPGGVPQSGMFLLAASGSLPRTVTTVYVGHLRFHSKPPNLHRRPIYRNHLTFENGTVELSITRANVPFIVQIQVVQLQGRYIALPIYMD